MHPGTRTASVTLTLRLYPFIKKLGLTPISLNNVKCIPHSTIVLDDISYLFANSYALYIHDGTFMSGYGVREDIPHLQLLKPI